jgi:iron complex transport system substrate-binding protein
MQSGMAKISRGLRRSVLFLLAVVICSGMLCCTKAGKVESASARRIISLSPNVTEILFALGLGDRVVGVTDVCKYPPEARAKPHVGTFPMPNIEQIVMLKPDLIILLPSYGETIDKFESLGLPMLVVKNDSIQEVLDSIREIAKVTGADESAQALTEELTQKLKELREQRELRARRRVLFVVGKNPGALQQIYAVGPGTFLDEMLQAAGGINILADAPASYPIVSKEEVIARDPEVILDASIGEEPSEEQRRINLQLWDQLQTVSAVKHHCIYFIEDPQITIPGPRIPESIEYLMRLIYKDAPEQLDHKLGHAELEGD